MSLLSSKSLVNKRVKIYEDFIKKNIEDFVKKKPREHSKEIHYMTNFIPNASR